MQMKSLLKDPIAKFCSQLQTPVLINSYGRSGSTLLTDAVTTGALQSCRFSGYRIVRGSVKRNAWDLEKTKIRHGVVYKTHDYPPKENLPSDSRMVYIFSDPLSVILSLLRLFTEKGEDWIKAHYSHLGVPYRNLERIRETDDLQLERHLDSWLGEDRFPIMFVRYESLWSNIDSVSEFLGVEVVLPPYRPREQLGNETTEVLKGVEATYQEFRERLSAFEDCFVNMKGARLGNTQSG